jgi:hypothetical protein
MVNNTSAWGGGVAFVEYVTEIAQLCNFFIIGTMWRKDGEKTIWGMSRRALQGVE